MIRTLDRYVIREVLPPFLLALLVFTFLLIIQPIMEQAESLLAKGVALTDVVWIILTLVPQALGIAIPVALLVGLLIGLGRLSGDRETVALLACGVSLYRLLRPVMILAVAATGVTLYVLIVAIPNANQTFREITYSIVAARAQNDIKPRVFFEDFPGKVLYVRDVPEDNSGWRGVFLADTTKAGQPTVYVAEAGHLVTDRETRRVDLVLEHGSRHTDEDVLEFDTQTISLDPDTVFPRNGPQRGIPEMSLSDLRAQIARKREAGEPVHNEVMAYQQKFSIPVACLVFAVIALALGVTSRKDGKMAGFVLGIGVVFLYYVVMYTAEALTKGGWLPADLSRWTPNVILGPIGIAALVWRARWAEGRFPLRLPRWIPRPAARRAPVTRSATTATGRKVVVVVRVPRLGMPSPTILDRYVSGLYLRVVALAFAGLLAIVYIAAFIDRSAYLFKGQASGFLILQYFWYETPQFIYWVLPLAVLLATLVTVGLLTKNSELTVMRACGISLYRTAAPLLVLALVASGLLFSLEESVLAVSHRQADAIDRTIRGRPPRTMTVANRTWLVGRNGDIYHYALYDPASRGLYGLNIYRFDARGDRLVSQTTARHAVYDGGWEAMQGWSRRYRGPGSKLSAETERFEKRTVHLEPPDYFETELVSADMMTFTELRRHIQELRASGFNVVPFLVQLQRKVAFPFVTLVMTLLAVPFAVTTGRRGALYGVGLGIALALTYWLLTSVFAAIGTAGLLTPLLAAWAPNLVFGAGAVYLVLTVRT